MVHGSASQPTPFGSNKTRVGKQHPLGVEHVELSLRQEEAVDFEKVESQRRLSKMIDADAIASLQDDTTPAGKGNFTAVILELFKKDQEMLQVAACLGNAFFLALLQAATATFTKKRIVASRL